MTRRLTLADGGQRRARHHNAVIYSRQEGLRASRSTSYLDRPTSFSKSSLSANTRSSRRCRERSRQSFMVRRRPDPLGLAVASTQSAGEAFFKHPASIRQSVARLMVLSPQTVCRWCMSAISRFGCGPWTPQHLLRYDTGQLLQQRLRCCQRHLEGCRWRPRALRQA